jgi:hypothetical protein
MIAAEMRVKNWSRIVPYLISFKRDTNRRLQQEIFARVEKPHRLEHLEAAFQPIDVSVVRASLFKLVGERSILGATRQGERDRERSEVQDASARSRRVAVD